MSPSKTTVHLLKKSSIQTKYFPSYFVETNHHETLKGMSVIYLHFLDIYIMIKLRQYEHVYISVFITSLNDIYRVNQM